MKAQHLSFFLMPDKIEGSNNKLIITRIYLDLIAGIFFQADDNQKIGHNITLCI